VILFSTKEPYGGGSIIMTMRRREQGPLARRLTSLREQANVRRRDLAREAGISEDTLASLEQGRLDNPTLKTLVRLARVFGVPATDLIDGADESWWS